MRTQTRSPTPCASQSRHCANASANPGSSPPWPASGTASAFNQTPGVREETVDRGPGLSVRLKLTLSYAGFLMLAGALLLAAVWVVILKYQPAVGMSPAGPLVRSDLLRSDGVPAGVRSAGRVDPRRPHARPPGPNHRRHTDGCERDALLSNPAAGPQSRVPRPCRPLRRHARTVRGARRRTAEIRGQRLP